MPFEFLDAVSHSEGVEAVQKTVVEWLPQLLPAQRASSNFVDGDRMITTTHWTDLRADPLDLTDRETTRNSPRAHIMKTRERRILSDQDLAQSNIPIFQKLHKAGLRSLMLVPMISGGEAVGMLSVGHSEPDRYNAQHGMMLQMIGKCISAQLRLMQEIRNTARRAETDALTGLANRARLMRVLDGPGALSQQDSSGRIVGVLHIDLDHFKEVNDTLGHAAGDAILKHAAKAMREAVGPKDLVARIGGDEFIVVSRTDPQGQQIGKLSKKIAAAVCKPLRFGDVEASVGASVGIALATGDDLNAERLIGNADIALYQAKRHGRGRVRAFTADMRAATEQRVRLLSDLHEAVETRAFEPYFQPQVSLKSGKFNGFEMLARWPHPELGVLDTGKFLDLVNEAGLAEQIDAIVRRKGLSALRDLRKMGWDEPRMAFNASFKTLDSKDLVETLLDDVLEFGLHQMDLVVELREADIIELGRLRAFEIIQQLSAAGFSVELDDFGAGLASMATLARVQVSGIKLDGSMIALLPDKRATIILRSAIRLARDLRLQVIAEGVEHDAQLDQLRRLGCDAAQGYLISQPLPFGELVQFIDGKPKHKAG
ncbi:diguanylate cyclase/phosphodiesterase (GGDEF & EAL domains) with PAS/PAC sensor(s) [Candidatus Rhodobacter oscarellae]|uniref:Diguanylate cyclase/phosphodiesterase (GGDEF & EAL domains) with PAS/PAC sensor(S) n=1 Tax=Candidatus Rhodobacter oscarellae TaxID=1675527 RepID=A0A0J9E216_9RHOB|nr:diguanylate cyclase/phosphodiesterase (GGDEF & EAL domains) with PAS/PAC sensor(s) [Candidatus Rhodobacter lobularis]